MMNNLLTGYGNCPLPAPVYRLKNNNQIYAVETELSKNLEKYVGLDDDIDTNSNKSAYLEEEIDGLQTDAFVLYGSFYYLKGQNDPASQTTYLAQELNQQYYIGGPAIHPEEMDFSILMTAPYYAEGRDFYKYFEKVDYQKYLQKYQANTQGN
ncbi:hypothetical protein [Ligilactobacillus pobuzihii]|uniref:Uncharacterized protein n=1 Tax=Ligilactobacillus pobuzihii TaxID=449659 RepID=A0A0R2L222_9LACO|nr:hypothetical protein [Ligilactobacillus pobuzihii]KRK09979.1 hypothetical protein FD11_GL000390 [Ligilactobacillus pobuzihii E100301 = KCTC 13174]KRN95601.1 hypothetical protein IV66_GL001047 [Ligilactobacillus pobuzihii]